MNEVIIFLCFKIIVILTFCTFLAVGTFINGKCFITAERIMNKKRGSLVLFLALAIVVLGFTFSLSSFFSVAQNETIISGCYYYSQARDQTLYCSEILRSAAQQDCVNCDLNVYFKPGSDCSELAQCKEVKCNVDCRIVAKGLCELKGGVEVTADRESEYCNPGCCKVPETTFCIFAVNKYQCEKYALSYLGRIPPDLFFYNPSGVTQQYCAEQVCIGQIKEGKISGFVFDKEGIAIINAEIVLEGKNKSTFVDSSGRFIFDKIPVGNYQLKVSKDGYLSKSSSLLLTVNSSKEVNFTLEKAEGVAKLSGLIKDSNGNVVKDAKVFVSGLVEDFVNSNESGYYQINNLPLGNYSLVVRKPGFQEIKSNLTLNNIFFQKDFVLQEIYFAGIKGVVYVDLNANNIPDTNEAKPGVKVYVDDNFKGYSKYPNGNFEIEISNEAQNISATYKDYSYGPEPLALLGSPIVLLLRPISKECALGREKPVEGFKITNVLGKKELMLDWKKPCPEVIGYNLKRINGNNSFELNLPPTTTSYLDQNNLEWDNDYTYEITVLYDQSVSLPIVNGPINTGNQKCDNKYHPESGWETFCFNDDKKTSKNERKSVWTCNDGNKLIEIVDCKEMDSQTEEYFCAPSSSTNAECKSGGECQFGGTPFGMYFTRSNCYGKENLVNGFNAQNFCYYDFTSSIVDQCKSCSQVESCFDYQSQDACEVNSCLGNKCNWINSSSNNLLIDYSVLYPGLILSEYTTLETGKGYCVEENYEDNDQCWKCSGQSNLFQNYYCTAEVCSNLGKCFSSNGLNSCSSCPKVPDKNANCYSYNTELECTGGKVVGISSNGELNLGDDNCNWKVCSWQGSEDNGISGSCIKDGNGDAIDDCAQFASEGERAACRKDISAPKTNLLEEGVKLISYGYPNITVIGSDIHSEVSQNNKMNKYGFCLSIIGTNSLDECTIINGLNPFTEYSYPGKMNEELLYINLINSTYLQNRQINGETYLLKYYSEDKYHNRENLRQGFVFIDNVLPNYELGIINETNGDKTKLTLSVLSDEPLSCDFKIQPIWPEGEIKLVNVNYNQSKQRIIFDNLELVLGKLNVSCKDERGNVKIKEIDLLFNLDQNISLIYPKLNGYASNSEIIFKVNTSVGAICTLYKQGQKVSDFRNLNSLGKEHETSSISGFVQGDYFGVYSVVCKELLDESKTHEAFFNFKVDFIGPETDIILKESNRKVTIPTKKIDGSFNYNWREYFIRKVNVSFECHSEDFPCKNTYYCLGDSCTPLPEDPNYKEFSGLTLNESTQICYYSNDESDGLVNVICGNIIIEGYGITLDSPEEYTFNKEKWGVSNKQNFTLQFFTRVPTKECRLDFNSNFNYQSLPQYKIRMINSQGKYVFEDFPNSLFVKYPENGGIKIIYVKCMNDENEIGPEQKINLEYDPTPPQILEAKAIPDLVIEDISTTLNVSTDDKTLCKYSDNSDGLGSSEYNTMEYSFPDLMDNILRLSHQDKFNINFLGASKDYSLNTICKNGAGDYSSLKIINFKVDYTASGNIVATYPKDYTNQINVILQVETNKNAYCEYKNSDGEYTLMDSSGGRVHTKALNGLIEKLYSIPVRCKMGDHTTEAVISFTVDLTKPVITKIDDGTYSCGRNFVKVRIYTNETGMGGYYYEVYDLGIQDLENNNLNYANNNSLYGASSPLIVYNGTLSSALPLSIPLNDLNETHKYAVKVVGIDKAGNQGVPQFSDGFKITSYNKTICDEDLSGADIKIEETSQGVLVEIVCLSQIGCDIKYGKASSLDKCKADVPYSGEKLIFDKSGYVCYYLENNAGQNRSGNSLIRVMDFDGDGILDKWDLCPNTEAGSVVDEDGCSDDQLSKDKEEIDTDGDKLPDSWEQLYNSNSCMFNFDALDSDDNGINDALEDYDDDTYNNYVEFVSGFDPCVANNPKEELNVTYEPISVVSEKISFTTKLAIIFLILGLLFFFGGTGYLIYYYRFVNGLKQLSKLEIKINSTLGKNSSLGAKSSSSFGLLQKFKDLKKEREEKLKNKSRGEVFESFSKNSSDIPHIDMLLQRSGSAPEKVQQLAEKYVQHKEVIAPGLKSEEKEIFKKLEGIAKQTKDKEISEVISKDEAQDIFSKLKDISKKRKK